MQIFQVVKMLSSQAKNELSNTADFAYSFVKKKKNPIQAIPTNFGSTFDQIVLYIFYAGFTEDAFLLFLYCGAKKVKDDQKLSERFFGKQVQNHLKLLSHSVHF